MANPKGINVAARAIKALDEGITYQQMVCNKYIEYCVNECGGKLKTSGMNDMVRNHSAWMGTLDNAEAEGKLVKGAVLLMWRDESEKLPAKYRGDGLGDFYHGGYFVGDKALYDADKNGKKRLCNAMHSSETMGRVAGTTTKNGWTHVMLLDCIDYDMDSSGLNLSADAEAILNTEPAQEDVINNEGQSVQPALHAYVQVVSANGGDVRIRERPEKGAIWKYAAPVGTRLMVMGEKNGFYKVMYQGKARWLDKNFAMKE